MKTIAIIDDDINISDMLKECLEKAGYNVIRAYSGTQAVNLLSDKRPDLIILDLMLPDVSGEDLLMNIDDIPVIVVGTKIDAESKVYVLMNGAVDCFTKPIDTKGLLKIIALRLRERTWAKRSNIIQRGNISLNTEICQVKVKEEKIRLTKTEFAILKLLMLNSDEGVSKSTILEKISGDTPDCTEISLKQHISNIRKKMRSADGKDHIKSVWGIGFQFQE